MLFYIWAGGIDSTISVKVNVRISIALVRRYHDCLSQNGANMNASPLVYQKHEISYIRSTDTILA